MMTAEKGDKRKQACFWRKIRAWCQMSLNPLSGPHQKFAEGIVTGLTQQAAYQVAYPGVSAESARVGGCRLLINDNIQQEIARLRKAAEETAGSAVMTLAHTLEFLSAVVRTPVGQLGPDDALVQDWLEENNAFGLRKRIRGCCKLKAIETLSRLTGRFQDTVRVESDKVVRVTIGD